MQQAPEPQSFLDLLAPAVRQAAAIARALEGRVGNEPKAGEASDVKAALTVADTAAQEAILVRLLEHFPGVSVQAEEDTESVSAFARDAAARVVVDPIDGTLHSYLEARGPYATMVGLAVDGRYEAALVALPREGLFFDGIRGGPARRTRPGGAARAWRAEATGPVVLVSHEMPGPVMERLQVRGFEIAFGCGGAIAVAPLIPGVRAGLRWARTAPSISVRGRIGLLIARAAGAVVVDECGAPFPEALDAPARGLAVAAEPADLEALVWALGAVEPEPGSPPPYMPA